jgi:hypothetical protein
LIFLTTSPPDSCPTASSYITFAGRLLQMIIINIERRVMVAGIGGVSSAFWRRWLAPSLFAALAVVVVAGWGRAPRERRVRRGRSGGEEEAAEPIGGGKTGENTLGGTTAVDVVGPGVWGGGRVRRVRGRADRVAGGAGGGFTEEVVAGDVDEEQEALRAGAVTLGANRACRGLARGLRPEH